MKPRSHASPDAPKDYLWSDLQRETSAGPALALYSSPSLKDAKRLRFLRAKAKHGPLDLAQDLELKVLAARIARKSA